VFSEVSVFWGNGVVSRKVLFFRKIPVHYFQVSEWGSGVIFGD